METKTETIDEMEARLMAQVKQEIADQRKALELYNAQKQYQYEHPNDPDNKPLVDPMKFPRPEYIEKQKFASFEDQDQAQQFQKYVNKYDELNLYDFKTSFR